MKNLIVRIGPGAPEQVVWAEQSGDNGDHVVRQGALAELAGYRGRRRVIVLVPAAGVLLTEVVLPPGRGKRALAAIPFALEEQLAAEVETLHFAYGRKQADNTVPVAVVAHELMTAWLAMLAEAGVEADIIVPEILAVPLEPGTWSVMVENSLTLVRTGIASGYAVDTENLETMLQAGLRSAAAGGPDNTNTIRISLLGGAVESFTDQGVRDRLIQTAGPLTEAADLFRVLAAGLAAGPPLNLLQGSYGPHAEWAMVWKRWRLPAVLLLAVVALQAGLLVYHVVRLGYESRELSRRMDQLLVKTFPDIKRIVNARAQMEQRLKALGGSDGQRDLFLTLLARSGDVLLKTPGFDLESLRYKDGRLEIDCLVRDLQVLDSLKTLLLSTAGLEVEIRTATAKGDRVYARLLLKEKTP